MRKKLDTRFPAARIKKIMQADEEVGKIALATPVLVSKALELFLQDLCDKTYEVTISRGAKTMSGAHLKQCVALHNEFDFLQETVARAEDACGETAVEDKGGRGQRRKLSEDDDDSSEPEDVKEDVKEHKRAKKEGGGGSGRGRGRGSKAILQHNSPAGSGGRTGNGTGRGRKPRKDTGRTVQQVATLGRVKEESIVSIPSTSANIKAEPKDEMEEELRVKKMKQEDGELSMMSEDGKKPKGLTLENVRGKDEPQEEDVKPSSDLKHEISSHEKAKPRDFDLNMDLNSEMEGTCTDEVDDEKLVEVKGQEYSQDLKSSSNLEEITALAGSSLTEMDADIFGTGNGKEMGTGHLLPKTGGRLLVDDDDDDYDDETDEDG